MTSGAVTHAWKAERNKMKRGRTRSEEVETRRCVKSHQRVQANPPTIS